jgi:hypothetical protein
MRHSAILALLLVMVINTVAAACVSDASGMRPSYCVRNPKPKMATFRIHRAGGCAGSVHHLPDTCRMRGFSQSPVAAIARVEQLKVGLARAAKVVAPEGPRFVVTSVGPPETDRGPPRS